MILVLGGTLEGREIASALEEEKLDVLLTVVSEYGAGIAPQSDRIEVLVKQLDEKSLSELIRNRHIKLIIDATHPYARVITDIAWKTANAIRLPYLRYQRPAALNTGVTGLISANSYQEAADMSMKIGQTVFLTIGSKNLEPFISLGSSLKKRVIVRVLPDAKVLSQCQDMGIYPKDIIAVQGPFSLEMNLLMFKEYGADVIVTKDSGHIGGTDAKFEAASQLKIPVVSILRPVNPEIPVVESIREVIRLAGLKVNY